MKRRTPGYTSLYVRLNHPALRLVLKRRCFGVYNAASQPGERPPWQQQPRASSELQQAQASKAHHGRRCLALRSGALRNPARIPEWRLHYPK